MLIAFYILSVLLAGNMCTAFQQWGPCPKIVQRTSTLKIRPSVPVSQTAPTALDVSFAQRFLGSTLGELSCANYTVPLDYEEFPSTRNISHFVYRYTAGSPGAKPALWMLQGGPGDSGSTLLQAAANLGVLTSLAADFDLYFPDHRGTGRSSPLVCPGGSPDAACIDFYRQSSTVKFFTAENAARDLELSMGDVQEANPDQTTLLYGVSYGTYWAQTLLLVADPQKASYPKLVVLDGVVPPGFGFEAFDMGNDRVGLQTLALCGSDPDCASRFRITPSDSLTSAYLTLLGDISMGSNKCAEKVSPDLASNPMSVRAALVQKMELLVEQWTTRPLVAPLVYRFRRCNDADVAALKHVFKVPHETSALDVPQSTEQDADVQISLPTYFNIGLSELWGSAYDASANPNCDGIPNTTQQAFFQKGVSAQFCLAQKGGWPTYTPNPKYWKVYPVPKNTKLLLLNGDLDPATPSENAHHAFLEYQRLGASVEFVTVPLAAHGTLIQGPTRQTYNLPITSIENCGQRLIQSFFLSKGDSLNKTCLDRLQPIDWSGNIVLTRMEANASFGTEDMWGDGLFSPRSLNPESETRSILV